MLLNNTTLTTNWVGRLFVFGHCVRQIIIDNITIIIIKCHRTGNFHFPGPQNDDDAMVYTVFLFSPSEMRVST